MNKFHVHQEIDNIFFCGGGIVFYSHSTCWVVGTFGEILITFVDCNGFAPLPCVALFKLFRKALKQKLPDGISVQAINQWSQRHEKLGPLPLHVFSTNFVRWLLKTQCGPYRLFFRLIFCCAKTPENQRQHFFWGDINQNDDFSWLRAANASILLYFHKVYIEF